MKNYFSKILTLSILAGSLFVSSCKDDDVNPSVAQIYPERAASNTVLTVKGAGLSDVVSITFETGSVPASFTSTFNTDGAILFRVPTDAQPGEQNIIFKNRSGKEFKVPFYVLGYPAVTTVSNYNFKKDSEITLTGKNLGDVTKVTFTADTLTEVSIVSSSATSLVLKFPATTLTESSLRITNGSGTTQTSQSFVALENAFQLFTDDYAPGYENASWGASGISTDVFKTGTASKFMTFGKGAWSQNGIGWKNTANANFKYLSFWIKGASQDYDLYIWSQQSPSGFSTFADYNKIKVPANVWTYFKIDVSSLQLWANGPEWNQIGWRIQGPDSQDETFYIDDVIFIK
ncbi:cell shape determination protein CcmA [Cytophagaceae bacterium YF14B1]|uniref:Cell shape determination protein CcmA n=1 Tax=Xanthocytophaga flava TaxID=3048013 RepID=A0AAE3QY22_9BACT|nr:IPT/TIG domain-containing protein [Xanthocytophaga flavus]MDJ1485563.1 cell shape determination protein CcmA [Xanthocytophaga flavus]